MSKYILEIIFHPFRLGFASKCASYKLKKKMFLSGAFDFEIVAKALGSFVVVNQGLLFQVWKNLCVCFLHMKENRNSAALQLGS